MLSQLRDSIRTRAARTAPPRDRKIVVLVDETLRADVLRAQLVDVAVEAVTLLGTLAEPPRWVRRYRAVPASVAQDDVDWFVQNGPLDEVIDLRHPKGGSRRTRWAQLFPHLRAGGEWVVPRQAARGDLRASERDWLVALARQQAAGLAPTNRSLDAESMRSVARLSVRPELLVIEKRLTHVVKLRDAEIMTTLARRDPQVQVEALQVLAAQTFHSPARITSHPAAVRVTGLDTIIAVPRMSVRHYRGPVAFSGQTLMFTENSVLADSFRFYHALDEVRGNLANPNLHDFDARLARVRAEKVPTESLKGDYYQVDPQSTGHFGHIMTELLARLWGWDVAKAQLPELKALLWVKPTSTRGSGAGRARLERTLLNAFGIADEDIVLVDRPVRVTSLVSATTMWHNWTPYFVHPAMADVWRRIAVGVTDDAAPRHDRIFVSRPADHWRRRCENTAEVEDFFAAHGFTIVYPERHTLGEQAALFAHATTIAGFGGSGMFSMMYAQSVRTIILLNQEGYTARNEHLFTAVLGCEVHYFWSTPTHVQPEHGWSLGAYQSEWSFDFARNEQPLTELLDSLDPARVAPRAQL